MELRVCNQREGFSMSGCVNETVHSTKGKKRRIRRGFIVKVVEIKSGITIWNKDVGFNEADHIHETAQRGKKGRSRRLSNLEIPTQTSKNFLIIK